MEPIGIELVLFADDYRITKNVKEKHIKIKFAESEELVDSFDGISLTWKYVRYKPQQRHGGDDDEFAHGGQRSSGGITPKIIDKLQELENQKKVVKIHNLQSYDGGPGDYKESVNLDHPSTFDTLAMDPKMKLANL